MKKFTQTLSALSLLLHLCHSSALGQCNWTALINDGFEYTTPVIGIMPGTTVHTTPQTFAVRSGTRSAYLNFLNCNGGAGTCAGTKVFERSMDICPGVPVRMNVWFATSFSGTQCDIKIEIRDGNGILLDSVPSLLPGYAPAWTNYISATLNPTTTTILFSIYTNIDGSNSGNDLSIDDYKLEQCVLTNTNAVAPICSDNSTTDLFDFIPQSPVNSGTWSGGSALGNGYLGTFTTGVNSGGQYIYTSQPYGTAVACPTRLDTIIAFPVNVPVVNLGNDTTICTTQSITLSTGATGNNTYLWSNGSTTSTLNIPAPGGSGNSVVYSVNVTNNFGCDTEDSVTINYVICSGLEDQEHLAFSLYPNPAHETLHLETARTPAPNTLFILADLQGKQLLEAELSARKTAIDLSGIPVGNYLVMLRQDGVITATSKLVIR